MVNHSLNRQQSPPAILAALVTMVEDRKNNPKSPSKNKSKFRLAVMLEDTPCPEGQEQIRLAYNAIRYFSSNNHAGRGGYAVSLYVRSNNAAHQQLTEQPLAALRLSFLPEPDRDGRRPSFLFRAGFPSRILHHVISLLRQRASLSVPTHPPSFPGGQRHRLVLAELLYSASYQT